MSALYQEVLGELEGRRNFSAASLDKIADQIEDALDRGGLGETLDELVTAAAMLRSRGHHGAAAQLAKLLSAFRDAVDDWIEDLES